MTTVPTSKPSRVGELVLPPPLLRRSLFTRLI